MNGFAGLDAAVTEADTAGFSLEADAGMSPERVSVARNRLYCLGYLWKDNQRLAPDADFSDALADFQQEAGLPATRSLDAATWLALEQLVAFESDTRLGRWYRRRTAPPVLIRAVRLRLTAFGLIDRLAKPTIDKLKLTAQEHELAQGLQDFTRVARLLNLSDEPLQPDFSIATLGVLFEQDQLVERLARMGRGMCVSHRPGAGRDEILADRSLVVNFVRSIARIELWLAGFATKPRYQYQYEYGGLELSLNQAMPEFWKSLPVPERPAGGELLDISGRFFTCLQRLADTATQSRIDTIVDQVMSNRETAKGVRDQMASLGARLWDGVRRAARWLFSIIAAGFRAVANLVTNLARLVRSAALSVYKNVRLLLQCCADSVKFILHTQFRPAASGSVILMRDMDFDFSLFIQERADPAQLVTLLSEFVLRCRLFAITARIAGRLAAMLMLVVRRTLIGGWFGLALVLARLSRDARQILRLARAAALLLERIEPTRIEAW